MSRDTESTALKMIQELTPDIAPKTLLSIIGMEFESKRRRVDELEWFAKTGYWPERQPGKIEADVLYFREYGHWPGEQVK